MGLADYHLALGIVGIMPAQQAMPRARELAQRALEIDPELPEAHAMLGNVAALYDFDWPEAERRFRLATAREPMTPHLREWYSQWLFAIGRPEDARRQNAQVIDKDPLCHAWHHMRAQVLQGLGLDDEALDASRKVVEIDPHFWFGWIQLGLRYAIHGRHAEALRCAEKGYATAPWSAYGAGVMAAALANAGQAEKAEPFLDRLRGDTYAGPIGLAVHYLARGDVDRAVEWAGKAADQRYPGIVSLVLRTFEPRLRQSAAWPALLKKVNLA